jgi:hypothetical protein
MDEDRRREHGTGDVTGFELLGGATLPVQVDLTVEITRSEPGEAAQALPPGTAEPLLEQQDRLLAWLEKSPENRLEFITDPVAGIERAGLDLDPDVIAALRDARGAAEAADAMPPGVELRSVRVEVDAERERPCRDDSEAPEKD